MLARVVTAALSGVEGYPVTVEADVGEGFPRFLVVGLPDAAVRESKERVISAIRNADAHVPFERVVVNLAPADVRKEGASFDLPMAVAVLAAAGVLAESDVERLAFVGELSLDGRVQAVRGILPLVLALREAGRRHIVLPQANVAEAGLVDDLVLYGARHLDEILRGTAWRTPTARPPHVRSAPALPDLADVRGHAEARRAIEIAAVGGHHLALVGPPGVGKTMIASRLPGLLPAPTPEESLEASRIHSVAGLLDADHPRVERRPFRAPHHTISAAGLLGGGSPLRPGEVSLAHRGVLFLDELPEMRRDAIEGLRQPLEEGAVRITRAHYRVVLPARFQLVVAMNPCPCGFLGSRSRACRCSPLALRRYRARVSGPIADRIDLFVALAPLRFDELRAAPGEASAPVGARIERAIAWGRARFPAGTPPRANAELPVDLLRRLAPLALSGERALGQAMEKLGLSARGHDRMLRVAKSIADLARSDRIESAHVAEAMHFREG